jgi:hypothetical protein
MTPICFAGVNIRPAPGSSTSAVIVNDLFRMLGALPVEIPRTA